MIRYGNTINVKQDVNKGWSPLIANQPYVLLPLTMFLWSGNWVAGRYVAGDIPPVTLTAIRWVLAFLILLAIGRRHIRQDLPALKASWKIMVVLGVLSIGAYNICVYIGLSMTTVINGTLLSSTFPITIAITAYVVYRDRLTMPQAIGILVATCGALVVMTRGDLAVLATFRFNAGDVWIMISQVIWSLYTIYLRERPAVHPMSFQISAIAVGLVPLVPAAALELAFGSGIRFTPGGIAASLYIAVFAAVIAYLCFNRAVALIGANRAGPFFHLVPVFASLLAVVVLGERIELYHLVGWTIIIAGIVVAQVGRRPARKSAPTGTPGAPPGQ
ncbi:DMT family transporter [Acuticoccus sediminis]|nr:DMT family transporter [Acuticoccus sediminis]